MKLNTDVGKNIPQLKLIQILISALMEFWGSIEGPVKAILAIISGGVLWEALRFFWPDIKRPFIERKSAKNSFYKNLDPILKASGELYGKLESLAKEDFSTFTNPKESNSSDPQHNQKYIYYLFAQLWAQLEFLRLESQYTSLSKINEGSELLCFIDTLESKKYRVLDRSLQRIIGESLITNHNQKFRILTLKEFLDDLENKNDTSLSKWIRSLELKLDKIGDKKIRQEFLRFGLIVGMLIDHFDPKHKTVRKRGVFINKLSIKSKQMIKWNLFKFYLPYIKKKERYY